MNNNLFTIADKLIKAHSLSLSEYEELVSGHNPEIAEYLKAEAVKKRKEIYGNRVFIRGLIEISNICKNPPNPIAAPPYFKCINGISKNYTKLMIFCQYIMLVKNLPKNREAVLYCIV